MNKIKNNIQDYTFYILLANPDIYLQRLLKRTLLIGFFTFIITYSIHSIDVINFTIPSTMHGLIGIVIGLLLVFRINTSYDRWWEGRKIISQIASEVGIISARLQVLLSKNDDEIINPFNNSIKEFLKDLEVYLTSNKNKIDNGFHRKQKKMMSKILSSLYELPISENHKHSIEISLSKMLDFSNSLERIKNTPIPTSFVLHIRICILIYLMSLPFGLFHDIGLWSTPIVMLVYYIISGVEIISTEIENPFAGDPNDLPVKQLFNNIITATEKD
jgi:putative membrane protein